jgi:hypothetical protein
MPYFFIMPLEVLVLGPVPLFRPCRGHDGSDIKNMDQYSTKTTRLLHANHEMMMIIYGLLKYKR